MTVQEREVVLESFGKIAKDVGKGLVTHAPTIGAVGGGVIGTVYGGPTGGAIGAQLGGSVGSAIGGQQPKTTTPAGGTPTIPTSTGDRPAAPEPKTPAIRPASGTPITGSPPNQLLILINNPHASDPRRQAGSARTEAGTLEAFSNAIGVFAEKLAVESALSMPPVASENVPSLQLTSPEERAEDTFQEAFEEREVMRNARRLRMGR